MRPRLDAAENLLAGQWTKQARATSMRPRLDAAENGRLARVAVAADRDFNEAAARCRGKRGLAFAVASIAALLQ